MKNPITPQSVQTVDQDQLFKLVVLIAALLALLYVALLLANESKQRTGQTEVVQQESNLPIEKVAIPNEKLPGLFPSDIPVETGVEIIENSQVTTDDGVVQVIRIFESAKSMNENYNLYLNYLTRNDWQITNQDNGSTQKLLRGKKGYQTLLIIMDPNPAKQTTTITLTMTES